VKGTGMAINTDMVGQTFGPFVRDYTFRDLELFALGCGAGIDGKDGLEYLNEHDERNPQLKVLPMFGAMLIVDSEVTRTIDYGYNYAGSLHWGFDIRFHQPITKMSDHLETMVRLEGLYDRGEGRGLLAQHIGDTYDSDGGYGHPDHVRVYEIVHRALQILEDEEDRPILTWGIEGEFDTADQRVQAAIYGDGTAKRKAMEAHRTQITVVDEKTFEYSNKVPQKISAVETFRVLDGDPTATVHPKPQEAGLVAGVLTGSILGIFAGIAGAIYHAWVVYAGDTALPLGLLVAYLTVFFTALWCALSLRRGYAAAVVAVAVFVTVYVLGYGRPDSPFVLVNPGHSAIGFYGALWWFGAPVAAMLGMLVYTRARVKDAQYFSPRAAHQRARAKK